MDILSEIGVEEFPVQPTYEFFGNYIEEYVHKNCPDICSMLLD